MRLLAPKEMHTDNTHASKDDACEQNQATWHHEVPAVGS